MKSHGSSLSHYIVETRQSSQTAVLNWMTTVLVGIVSDLSEPELMSVVMNLVHSLKHLSNVIVVD